MERRSFIMGDLNDVRNMDERLVPSFMLLVQRVFDRFNCIFWSCGCQVEGFGVLTSLSDHRPILLREVSSDFGPTPFRFYQSWFKKKLQDLKSIIRLWVKDKKFHLHNAKNSLQNDLISIDKDLEVTILDGILLNRWILTDGCKSQLSIRGVFVEGTWCTDPSIVKEAFKNHFEVRFQQPCHDRLKLNAPFHNRLSSDQVDELDRAVSRDEIRRAVWNCGENKSPGPDGYTFEFFRKYWSLVGADFCDAVDYFFKSGLWPSNAQGSMTERKGGTRGSD
ncbi:hypothetical protein Tco_0606469 [Tanacetum coccineum]